MKQQRQLTHVSQAWQHTSFLYRSMSSVSILKSAIYIVIPLVMLPFVGSGHAGSLHALVNGKAIHLEAAPAGKTFNEENWGGGLQYDFDPWHKVWVPFVTASGFLDSNSNASYYAGGGLMRRFMISESLDNLYVDIGAVAFLMTRKGFHHNGPFLGVTYTGTTNETAVTVTDAGLAAGLATNPFTLVNPGWGTFSGGMTADVVTDPTAVSAATFAPSGDSAMVVANSGKTIMMGFMNDTNPAAADMIALYAASITTTTQPVAVAPIVAAGGGGCALNT